MVKVRKYFRDPDSLELNKFLFTSDSSSSSSSSAHLKNKNVRSHSFGNSIDSTHTSYCIRTTFKSYNRQTLEDAITIFQKFKNQYLYKYIETHEKSTQTNDTSSYAIQTIIDYSSEASLPTKIRRYCVLTSPHVNSDAREHFEIRVHKSIIDTLNPPDYFFPMFKKITFPPGVDIQLCHISGDQKMVTKRAHRSKIRKIKKNYIKRNRKGRRSDEVFRV
jgi:small subunit ribosomal protein S10